MEKQRKTFLSYSRVNKDFAIRLAQELKAEGFEIWLDQLDIPPGAWWDDEVERALEECEIFMVIVTPSSSASKNVKDEIGYALDANKRILPILLENATLPLRLRRLQYVDFTAKGFDEGVNAAKDLLRRLTDQPTLPRIDLSEEQRQQLAQPDTERTAEAKLAEEAERLAQEKAEAERVAQARAKEERLAQQRAEEERIAKAEADRKAKAESRRQAKEEAERLAAQQAEEQRIAQQKEAEELAAKAEAEKIAAQKAEAERKAKQQAERLAAQRTKADTLAKQKADEELAGKAKAEQAAKEEAERLSRQRAEQMAAGQAEVLVVPVTAEAAQQSAPAVAARKPVARGLLYGIALFVLLCGGIGFGILYFLMNQSPSSPPNTIANTAARTPTNVPERVDNPTNTSVPSPKPTAVSTATPTPTLSPTEIEIADFTVEGPWTRLENCPDNKEPCWTESPSGTYPNDMYYAITSSRIPVDETWENPHLIYWQKYNTEGEYDFVQIKINGIPVRTNSGTTDWHQIAIELESYKGRDITVSFLMASDYSIVGDGWYLHDIKILPNATSAQLQSARIVEP